MATAKKGARKGGSKSASKKSSSRGGAAKKGAAKRGGAAKKGGAAKRGGAAKKRTPNASFMRPMQPSAQLGAVVGNNPMPRTEVTKKLWAYIKKNDLQDKKERRMIKADDRLRPIFRTDRVSMFDMTKLVNKHLSDS